jgi:hypothetical protein
LSPTLFSALQVAGVDRDRANASDRMLLEQVRMVMRFMLGYFSL